MPALAQAWRDGRVGRSVVLAAAHGLVGVEDAEVRAAVEHAVLEFLRGPHGAADDVGLLVRQAAVALGAVDPDEGDRRAHEQRRLGLDQTFEGVWHLNGTLTPEAGSRLKAVLDRLSPRRGPEDDRDVAQRRHDALAEVVAGHEASDGGRDREPNADAGRERVGVVVDHETLVGLLDRQERRQPGSVGALALWRGLPRLDRLDGPGGPGAGVPAGFAVLADGTLVGPATARRLACDAEVLPVVLGSEAETLDVGRTTRTWPLAVRRAAWLRAGSTCEVSWCSAPHVDLHHKQHWADGGPTSLANAVFLCGFHHWLVHHGPFDVVPEVGAGGGAGGGGHRLVRTDDRPWRPDSAGGAAVRPAPPHPLR